MGCFVYCDVLEEKLVPHADNSWTFGHKSSMDISTRQQANTHF